MHGCPGAVSTPSGTNGQTTKWATGQMGKWATGQMTQRHQLEPKFELTVEKITEKGIAVEKNKGRSKWSCGKEAVRVAERVAV